MKKHVDARGLSCPQPILLAKRAIDEVKSGTIEVLVDSSTAAENVERTAHKAGWTASRQDDKSGSFTVVLNK